MKDFTNGTNSTIPEDTFSASQLHEDILSELPNHRYPNMKSEVMERNLDGVEKLKISQKRRNCLVETFLCEGKGPCKY